MLKLYIFSTLPQSWTLQWSLFILAEFESDIDTKNKEQNMIKYLHTAKTLNQTKIQFGFWIPASVGDYKSNWNLGSDMETSVMHSKQF